jgi:hypothetical protein
MSRHSSMLRIGAALSAVLIGATAVSRASEINRQFQLPATMNLSAAMTGCANSPGPQITLQGEMTLAGLGLDIIFRNNVEGTHTYTVPTMVEAEAVPAGQGVSIPKQPVLGGIGGNPFIWLQLFDEDGRAMTSEVYLGRCVEGQTSYRADLALPASASAQITTAECSNSPGPSITIDGEMALSGINAQLIFRNNDNPVGGPHIASDTTRMNLVLLPAGQSITFPKQPVLGGVGGNPWISLQFVQDNGDRIGKEALMGRCVQLEQ